MSDEEYDEFGNLIGGDSQSDYLDTEASPALVSDALVAHQPNVIVATPQTTVADHLEPVIRPKTARQLVVDALNSLATAYSKEYMVQTMTSLPDRQRNVMVVGLMGCGKTLVVDMLVQQAHPDEKKISGFTHLTALERQRQMTLSTYPVTILLPNLDDQSYVVTILDTPGHPDFYADVEALYAGDCCVTIAIDAVEGLGPYDKVLIDNALKNKLPLSVIITKLDRIILDLRLSPDDCHSKLRYVIDEIQSYVATNEYNQELKYAVTMDDVVFSSAKFGFMASIASYVRQLSQTQPDISGLQRCLTQGYWYKDGEVSAKKTAGSVLAFTAFILNPLYKVFTHTLVHNQGDKALPKLLWDEFGISFPKSTYEKDPAHLLRDVLKEIFIGTQPYIDVLLRQTPPSSHKVEDPAVLGKVLRLVRYTDEKHLALVKLQRSVSKRQRVTVIAGEITKENSRTETVKQVSLGCGPYSISLDEAPEGSIVLIEGIDATIVSTGYICEQFPSQPEVFPKPPNFWLSLVLKVAIEPMDSADLPKMTERVRWVLREFLAAEVKVELLGEHTIFATGELYLDCLLSRIRGADNDIQLRVTIPLARFSETVEALSVAKIETTSKQNLFTVMAEPLQDKKLSRAIAEGRFELKPNQPVKTTAKILRKEYGWDALAARSLWCFGPRDNQLPSLLTDDTLEGETDKALLYSVKDSVTMGFQWCVSEGPLCDEPIRNTHFRIVDATLLDKEIYRSTSTIVPLVRKACCAGFMTASPRLMEPIYRIDIVYSGVAGNSHALYGSIKKLVMARRGEITFSEEIPGSPLHRMLGYVPVIDSVGLETDIRVRTQGQAMCYLSFSEWLVVPGDPLDADVHVEPLLPATGDALARDFVMKTRARKGLNDAPSYHKYIEPEVYEHLQDNGLLL